MSKHYAKQVTQILDTETDFLIRDALEFYGPYTFVKSLTEIMRDMVDRKQFRQGHDAQIADDMARDIRQNVLPKFDGLSS